MVDGQQDHGFDKLCWIIGPATVTRGSPGKHRRTLGYGPYVAFKLKIAQIIEKGLREALAAAKICNILLGKMQVVEVFNQLFHACMMAYPPPSGTRRKNISKYARRLPIPFSKYPFAIVNS